MGEEWRPVAGWEDYYEVSNLGRVRSSDRMCHMRNGRKVLRRGRVLNSIHTRAGYTQVSLSHAGKRKAVHIHRLVAAAFLGDIPSDLEVCHADGDPTNNRADNLRIDTHQSNLMDRHNHGRMDHMRGEGHVWSTLSESDVRAIRSSPARQVDIASRFGISQTHVSRIKQRQVWGWLADA